MKEGPVVTGQQIGLLGGPLYTPYKVLTALHLARKEGRECIYWLETNDADFQEISAVDYIDRGGELRQLRWQKDTGGLSCGHVVVDRELLDLLAAFFDSLMPTEFTHGLRTMAFEAYSEGQDLGSAALALAKRLYPFPDLRFFDPRDGEFIRFCRQILKPLFAETEPDAQCPGFISDQGVRRAVFRTKAGYALRGGRAIDLDAYPMLPNVHTRPLCQDAYFKSSVYIAGPGEMAYLPPLNSLYRRLGISQPRLQARMSLTLVEPWTKRQLVRLGMDAPGLLDMGFDAARKMILDRIEGPDIDRIEAEVRGRSQTFVDELMALHPQFSLVRSVLRTELKQALGAIRKEKRERSATDLERLRGIGHRLLPYGKPQERVMNLFYFMNLYGGIQMMHKLMENTKSQKTFLEVS